MDSNGYKKLAIRLGMFETNSSLMNTVIIMPTADYNRWVDGDFWNVKEGKIYTEEEVIKKLEKDGEPFVFDDTEKYSERYARLMYYTDYGYLSYNVFTLKEALEEGYCCANVDVDEATFVTEHGDSVTAVAVGEY